LLAGGRSGVRDVPRAACLFYPDAMAGRDDLFGRCAGAPHPSRRAHSENPKPSWYGESVGHYEGGTLVIDTVAPNDKTFVDYYRTPHSTKLHVVERWKLIEDGQKLEVTYTVDDPDAFNQPWSAVRQYRRVRQPMLEEVCAENNQHLFDYHIPVADKPDF